MNKKKNSGYNKNTIGKDARDGIIHKKNNHKFSLKANKRLPCVPSRELFGTFISRDCSFPLNAIRLEKKSMIF